MLLRPAWEKGRETDFLKECSQAEPNALFFMSKDPFCHVGKGLFYFIRGSGFIEAGYQSTESRRVWLHTSLVHLLKMGKACTSTSCLSTHTSVRTDTGQTSSQMSFAEHPEGHQKTIFFFSPSFCFSLPTVTEGLKQTHNLLGSV